MLTYNLDRNLIVFGNSTIDSIRFWDVETTIVCFGAKPKDTLVTKVTEMLVDDALSMSPVKVGEMLTTLAYNQGEQVWIQKVSAHNGMDRYYRVIVTSEAIYAALIQPSDKIEGFTKTVFIPPTSISDSTKAICSTMRKV